MATYGLKYICEFDSKEGQEYLLEFSKIGYVGSVSNIEGGASPVLHQWQADNDREPVKGSILDINLLNQGTTPLSEFYSVRDNEWRTRLTWVSGGSKVIFEGFLLQSDCEEAMVDYTHPIALTATDGLGILKDVPLNQAASLYGNRTTFAATSINIDGFFIGFVPTLPGGYFYDAGWKVEIVGGGIDGIYEIRAVVPAGVPPGTDTILILTTSFGFSAFGLIVDFTFIEPVDLELRMSYAKIIRLCLLSTNLELNLEAYTNIIEIDATIPRFLEETILAPESYLNGAKWESCYSVLDKIMRQFNAVLMQSGGKWNIQRWSELRRYSNATISYLYDSDMDFLGGGVFDNNFQFDPVADNSAVNEVISSIVRPCRFIKHTYNYRQPENLLKNSLFNILGNLITSYTVGPETYTEYELPQWDDGPFAPPGTRYIRVVSDTATGIEKERYAVVTNSGSTDDPRQIQSQPIEVNAGGRFKYSFSYKTDVSQPGNVVNVFAVSVFDGTTTQYVHNNGTWQPPIGFSFNVLAGDNTNQWHDVEISSDNIPADGYLYVFLAITTASSSDLTYYKNLRFEYIPAVNESVNIIGQIHTNTQFQDINNIEELEIFQDDSPSNNIAGTMFLPTFGAVLQDRALLWEYATGTDEQIRSQHLITFEKLFKRRIPRTKLRGTLYGLTKSNTYAAAGNMNFFIEDSVNYIGFAAETLANFPVGAQVTITGTLFNDGTYTILTSIQEFVYIVISVASTVTTELLISASFSVSSIEIIQANACLQFPALLSGLNFIFGSLSIDYSNDNFDFSLYEEYNDTEVDADLADFYLFEYIYRTK